MNGEMCQSMEKKAQESLWRCDQLELLLKDYWHHWHIFGISFLGSILDMANDMHDKHIIDEKNYLYIMQKYSI